MHIRFLAVVAAIAVATPVAAMPAQTGDALLNQLLDQADSMVEQARGAFSVVATLRGSLDDGDTRSDTVRLSSGGDYVVIGVCDEDCADFDLSIRDASGEEIDSDYLDDDAPMLEISDARGGEYRIESMMADCEIAPCRTAVRVYRVD